MFVVCMGDGLGNQMFHYAFYCALKKKYPNNKVLANIEDFYGSMNLHNGFELEKVFGIKVEECSHFEALMLADYNPMCVKNNRFVNQLFKYRKEIFGPKQSYITVDDPTAFYEEVFHLNPLYSYMFRGNWINEKYFVDVKQQILEDFCFPQIEDEQNLLFKKKIEETLSVSMHVRRGDYVGGGMEQLTRDYYQKAIATMTEKLGQQVKFFIFSDDSEYVRKEFSFIKNYEVVACNGGATSFRDMQLMSLCKHNIISNSTFAFWGAYLNRNSDKIVIAPKKAAKIYRNPFACEEWLLL